MFVNGNTGGKAKRPIRHVINRLALFGAHSFARMGIDSTIKFDVSEVAEAVKMDCSVFMPLRHHNILKTLAAGDIIQPFHNPLFHSLDVIAVNHIRVKRPCDKVLKLIAQSDIANSTPGTAHRAGGSTFPVKTFSLRRHII